METSSRAYLTPDALTHFGLALDPFDDPPSPDDCWLPPAVLANEHQLVAAVRRRNIVVLTGEVGAGKSIALRRLFFRMSADKNVKLIAPASIDRSKLTETALSVAILRDLTGKDCSSMAMEARSELVRAQLAAESKAGNYPVLLIDEAHKLTNKGLIALKQVWDSHIMFRQVAVVLVGQPPLAKRLRQDVTLKEVTLRALMIEAPAFEAKTQGGTVADYLRWRFSRVNADANRAFSADAYTALGVRTEYPLVANNLAIRAMLYAAHHGDPTVTAGHVGRV